MKKFMARQGDVLIERVAKPRRSLKAVKPANGRHMLAYGEATGHHHSLPASAGTLSLDEGGVMYLTIDELTAVEHQEHNPIPLEPGTYKVTVQREYTPQQIQNVRD